MFSCISAHISYFNPFFTVRYQRFSHVKDTNKAAAVIRAAFVCMYEVHCP